MNKNRIILIVGLLVLFSGGIAVYLQQASTSSTDSSTEEVMAASPTPAAVSKVPHEDDKINGIKEDCGLDKSATLEFSIFTADGPVASAFFIPASDEKTAFSSGKPVLEIAKVDNVIRWAQFTDNFEGSDYLKIEGFCFNKKGSIQSRLYVDQYRDIGREKIGYVQYKIEYDDNGLPKPDGIEFTKEPAEHDPKNYEPNVAPPTMFKNAAGVQARLKVERSQ